MTEPLRWTTSDRLDDPRYQYRDRYCWISEDAGLFRMQEMLVAPHDDFETIVDRSYRLADFLSDAAALEQLRAWFGNGILEEILQASRELISNGRPAAPCMDGTSLCPGAQTVKRLLL